MKLSELKAANEKLNADHQKELEHLNSEYDKSLKDLKAIYDSVCAPLGSNSSLCFVQGKKTASNAT